MVINKLKMKLYENRKALFYVILIAVILFPMVYTIFYSLPSADDFSMISECERSSLFRDSINRANERYMNWSGLWPYMFIEMLANPLMLFSLESGWSGVEMVFLFLAFIVSFMALVNMASKKILGIHKKETIAFFTLVIIFVFLNTNIYREVFYWFVGSSYMMALTLGCITITLTIKFMFDEKIARGGGFLLALSGSLACNFFQEAILPGMAYIVLWCWCSMKEHRLLWKKTIPFWIMFVSGLISVGAPGNYARHTAFDSSLNIGKACVDSCRMVIIILNHMIQQPLIFALMIFCIYIGIRYTQKTLSGKIFVLSFFLFILTLFLNAFPIALGYAGVSYMPNRIYFVLDFTAMIGIIIVCICLGMYVKGLSQYKSVWNHVFIEIFMTGMVCLLLYSTLVYTQNIKELPWFQTAYNVREVKAVHDAWMECLLTIRDSEESRIEFEMNQEFFASPILTLPQLRENEDDWVNVAIAQHFGKESVIVRVKEE